MFSGPKSWGGRQVLLPVNRQSPGERVPSRPGGNPGGSSSLFAPSQLARPREGGRGPHWPGGVPGGSSSQLINGRGPELSFSRFGGRCQNWFSWRYVGDFGLCL